MRAEAIRGLVGGLPSEHPARIHAARLAGALGASAGQGQHEELLQTAAWHFAAFVLARDPELLVLERSGHNAGMHSDLVVRAPDRESMVGFTWTSGVRSLSGAKNVGYVDEFLLRRKAEEKRLERVFAGGSPDERHHSVAAALVVRAATDPSLGWVADVEDGEYGDQRGPWLLGPEGGDTLAVVDIGFGTITSTARNETLEARDLARLLSDPRDGLTRVHGALTTLVAKPARMRSRPGPTRILHVDWGIAKSKRQAAEVSRTSGGWLLEAVGPWSDAHRAEVVSNEGRLLVGFDFPIGLPHAFAASSSIVDFPGFLLAIEADDDWSSFYEVCEEPQDISLRRPFYPRNAPKGSRRRRADLESGLGLSYDRLLRECERRTDVRGEASALFWLIGAKQVGRGAITGWREVIAPALRAGARLWPFHGDLTDLVERGGVTIVETYPAEFYGHLGLPRSGWSKTKQGDRAKAGVLLLEWADRQGVAIAPDVAQTIYDGFGPRADGEDPFDAAVGALGMIRALDRGPDIEPVTQGVRRLEGWILGQARPTRPERPASQ